MNIQAERKFTFLNLEIRKLSQWDKIILASYAIAIVALFVVTENNLKYRIIGLFIIAIIAWDLTTLTSFGLRFRNIYFFITWLTLSIILLFAGTSISLIPLCCFILYQFVRLHFWKRYSKEFIPLQLRRLPKELSKLFQLRFYIEESKIEGRCGDQEDIQYMKWLVQLGFCVFMICVYGLVGMKF